jgi:hypothetical protein
MNTREIGEFLGRMAIHDKRNVGPMDIMAWEEDLPGEISLADALAALRDIRRDSPDWIMPSHVVQRVMQIRRERLRNAGTPPIPGGCDWRQEKAWRELWCTAIKDGSSKDEATAIANHQMGIQPLAIADSSVRAAAIDSWASGKAQL